MYVKKGKDRIVVVIPRLGIVVKLPRIKIYSALRITFFSRGGLVSVIKRNLSYDVWCLSGYRSLFFKSILINWYEFWFYQTTKNPLLQPTYFSLFGLLNIQKIGLRTFSLGCGGMYRYLEPYLDLRDIQYLEKDGHHFFNSHNFCLTEGGLLRMVDYGDEQTMSVISKVGGKLSQVVINETVT